MTSVNENPGNITEKLARLSDAEVKQLQGTLRPILETQRARIEYAESRRATFGVLGGVLLAAGTAGVIQLATRSVPFLPAQVGLLVLTLSLILAGICVVYVYSHQMTWGYPFKSGYTGTWKWFYRDAIPGASSVAPNTWGTKSVAFEENSQRVFNATNESLPELLITLTDPRVDLQQDIQQIHLLCWNEFYKNRFLERLRSVLVNGVYASISLGALAFAVTLIVDHCR